MKKYTLMLLAGGMIAFASCGGNNNESAESTQTKIDSAVDAKVDAAKQEMQAHSDSVMAAQQAAQAAQAPAQPVDSMQPAAPAAPAAPAKTVSKTHTSTTRGGRTTTTTTTTTDAPTVQAPKQTITNEQKKEQDNKFNER